MCVMGYCAHLSTTLEHACDRRVIISVVTISALSPPPHTSSPTGINILLISRTESKLKDTAAELESKYKVQTSYVAADLTACTDAKWTEIKNAIDAVEVGLLINNAGISYDHAEYTDLVDEKLVNNLIEMNMRALTKVCVWGGCRCGCAWRCI